MCKTTIQPTRQLTRNTPAKCRPVPNAKGSPPQAKAFLHPKAHPVFSWAGGKRLLLKYILPHVPKHTCSVEVFGGGAAFTLTKERSEVEIINDIHNEVVNVFRCARCHPEALVAELNYIPNSRAEFFEFIKQPGITDIQRAARWLYRRALCFGESETSYGVQMKSGGGACSNLQTLRDRIGLLAERLTKVSIENRDWRDILRIYDRPETFFFIDPPYIGGKQASYESWNLAQMEELAGRLQSLQGKWILTVNDSKELRSLFAFGIIQAIERNRGIANKGGSSRYGELIIRSR